MFVTTPFETSLGPGGDSPRNPGGEPSRVPPGQAGIPPEGIHGGGGPPPSFQIPHAHHHPHYSSSRFDPYRARPPLSYYPDPRVDVNSPYFNLMNPHHVHHFNPGGLATNSIFSVSFSCLEGKSMTPRRGNILFRSSQQLPRLCLGPSKGFLS